MPDGPPPSTSTEESASLLRRLARASHRHRLLLVWAGILLIVTAMDIATVLADARRQGRAMSLSWAILLEGSSHLVLAGLLPALYWLHARFPVLPPGRNILVHLAATVPFSLAHVLAMFALRALLAPLFGGSYAIRLDPDTLLYEYRKDVVTYLIFSAALIALRHVFGGPRQERHEAAASVDAPAEPAPAPERTAPARPLDRFAVRRKDREILVSAQDIAWIEAAGNYAILHVRGETYDIRSSLSRLEAELDPRRFVRVHKSYIVNVERVREVEPWIGGDSRLKLDDGAVVSLRACEFIDRSKNRAISEAAGRIFDSHSCDRRRSYDLKLRKIA